MARTAPATPQIPWVYPNESYKFPWDDLGSIEEFTKVEVS